MTNKEQKINLRVVLDKVRARKKTYLKVWAIVFIITSAYMLCLPRNYTSSVRLAPELGGDGMSNGFSDLASSLGFGAGTSMSNDAISPMLYPDLMDDNGFVASLLSVRVPIATDNGSTTDTTYYAYLKYFQQAPFWSKAFNAIKQMLSSSDDELAHTVPTDPYDVSMREDALMQLARQNINISIDKETAVITISVKAQSPHLARIMADSVKTHLQDYVTHYRTEKSRVDLEYYHRLRDVAWHEYDSVCTVYGNSYDANRELVMRSVALTIEKIERDMQVKYSTYTQLESQYQAALAKVQERTPAFVTLKGAEVPVLPSSPRRTFNVICMLVLATFITTAWIVRREIVDALLS